MKNALFIFALLALVSTSNALYEDLQTGARALGMADASVALSTGGEAVRYNVAGLAEIDALNLSTYYKSLYGGISGLHNLGVTVALPLRGFSSALSFYEIGVSLDEGKYSESTITLSLAREVREDLSLGLNLNLFKVNHPTYGSSNLAMGADIGVLGNLYDKWKLGIFIENFKKPVFHGEIKDYSLKTAFNFGIAFIPYERARSSISVRKEEDFPARVAFGQEVDFFKRKITLRVGVSHEERLTKFAFGFTANVKGLSINYGAQLDPNLPMTHIIGINIGGAK